MTQLVGGSAGLGLQFKFIYVNDLLTSTPVSSDNIGNLVDAMDYSGYGGITP